MNNSEKISKEKIELLKNLADILKPQKIEGIGRVIKTRNFIYPINKRHLAIENKTSVELHKGDILLSDSFSGKQKFILINKSQSKLYPSTFLIVIRPKAISSEYLFLYLQSETAKKYFLRNKSGGYFPRIPTKKLGDLPIVLPDIETEQKSFKIFNNLFLNSSPYVLKDINKELFKETKIIKPIQKEFLEEELNRLRIFKKDILEKIIRQDFKELDLCREHKLYKSFLILAGSILEAYLLDWLSEIEEKDYFESSEKFTLGVLIFKRLKDMHPDIFNENIIAKSNEIMKKRNLVHPKEFFNSSLKINDNVCNEVISDLRFVLNSRN